MSTANHSDINRVMNQPRVNQHPLERILHVPLIDLFGLVVLFLAGFWMLVNVQVDKSEVALDGQVLLKLAVIAGCGLYGVYGLLGDPRVRMTLFSFPVFWVVLIVACFFFAAPGSITPKESLASAIAMACITMMTVTAVVQLGPVPVVVTLFYSLSAYVVLSWAAYFLWPAVGVFAEPIGNGEFKQRMGGLSHPNTLGQFSGLTIVIGTVLYVRLGHRSLFRIAMILLAGLALASSLSRTSMLATGLGLAVAFRMNLLRRQWLLPGVTLMLAGSIVLLILVSTESNLGRMVESKLALLSKSGDAAELTSATGRTEIWAFTIEKIMERPLLGYGAATSKYYLQEYSKYTHNMILNVAFSTGVIGGLLALMMCLGRIWQLMTSYHRIADGIVAFLLINGLFENVMFSFLAGLPTIIWIVALCLPRWWPESEMADADQALPE